MEMTPEPRMRKPPKWLWLVIAAMGLLLTGQAYFAGDNLVVGAGLLMVFASLLNAAGRKTST